MTRRPSTSVVALGLSTVVGHLFYPAALAVLTRGRASGPSCRSCGSEPSGSGDPPSWPPLTVVVPAYLEAGVIADKVDDLRANGYPGEVEVLVVAEDRATAVAARRRDVRVLEPGERLGKSQALNVGVEAASHDVVVLTDANNRLAPGSLAALVRHFADPHVGAVAGEKVESDAGGEELYWRFESWVKQREWALGTTIGVTGESVAVRRQAWRPIPPTISSDDLWVALDWNERGWVVAYEPAARSIEPPAPKGRAQWERRTRIVVGRLFAYSEKRALLHPSHGLLAFEAWGHHVWRSTVGPISHLGLVVLALGRVRRSRLAALFLGGHVVAGGALAWRERGHRLPGRLNAPVQVLYLQFVALAGIVRFLRRDRALRWDKPAR